jgi:hypothetical protein
MPRASELLYGIELVGRQVKLREIAGVDIEVYAVSFFEDDFAPGAVILGELQSEYIYLITYSTVVLETLEKLEGKTPYTARFVSHRSGSGRSYYTIE